jgi:phenylalanyl-tRNA synthetase beta chain
MKVSHAWLQTFFDAPLPEAEALGEALTFHAFEIDGIEKMGEDDVLDVKITPNRGHDALSHRAIAKELAAILNIKLKSDPLRSPVTLEPKSDIVRVAINTEKCDRFTGCVIRGVKVGPSPDWMKHFLENIGQRPINNIVDATNYVMFHIGQPLHAFDIGKLVSHEGTFSLEVRVAQDGEKLMGLDDKEYELKAPMLVIEDKNAGVVASIAGIKGGKPTGIDEGTTDVFLEAANWDGVTTRKTSQMLKLRTDASDRFQQVMSPEFAPVGLRAAADLIVQIAEGEIVGFVDEYPRPQGKRDVTVSVAMINKVLGVEFSVQEVSDVLTRLDLPHVQQGDAFTVHVPGERLDIVIPEDIAEEVGRILGYDRVPSVDLPPFTNTPEINQNFHAAEKIREDLMSKGYSEVYTSVFVSKGERAVANKVDSVNPFLRSNLTDSLQEALKRNVHIKDLLGVSEVKLFQIGSVWTGGKEEIHVATIGEKEKPNEYVLAPSSADSYDALPLSETERYRSFSRYPFIVRDIALWVPAGTEPEEVLKVIRAESGDLLQRSALFDRFEKEGRISYAFRLVFQSFDKTLTDEEANAVMQNVNTAVKDRGWEVR